MKENNKIEEKTNIPCKVIFRFPPKTDADVSVKEEVQSIMESALQEQLDSFSS